MSQRYERIAAMKPDYPLNQLCDAFEVSRSGFHAWSKREPSVRQQANLELVETIRSLRQGREVCYGSPRMTRELNAQGKACSENRVAGLSVILCVRRVHGLFNKRCPRITPQSDLGNGWRTDSSLISRTRAASSIWP